MAVNFGTTKASALYVSLSTRREGYINRAEEQSAFTIPSVFPRRGHTPVTSFVPPKQSLGAQAVTSLTNKLTSVLLPSNAMFFRHVPDRAAREFMAQAGDNVKTEVEETLAQIERDVRHEIEVQGIRVPAHAALEQLVVAGNVLVFYPEKGGMQYFPLSQYVVARDAADNLLAVVIKETIAEEALTPEQSEAAKLTFAPLVDTATPVTGNNHPGVDVYTKLWLDREKGKTSKWRVVQEVREVEVDGTHGDWIEDEMPYRPLRWSRVSTEEYGRAICEEYIGSLRIVEQLTKSIVEGAMAAARILPLISPNGTTDINDINRAENGEAVYGNEEDVKFMHLDKFADMRVARETLDIERAALQSAFLMTASVTRQAERVTAEEIRIMSQELEASLGGVYAALATEFQLPLVQNVTRQLQRRDLLPKFEAAAKDHIKPTILTGVDALGRREELDRMMQAFTALQAVIGPEKTAQYANVPDLIRSIFTAAGVDSSDIIKSEEQVQEESQAAARQAMTADAVSKAAGPLAAGAAQSPETIQAAVSAVQQAQPQ